MYAPLREKSFASQHGTQFITVLSRSVSHPTEAGAGFWICFLLTSGFILCMCAYNEKSSVQSKIPLCSDFFFSQPSPLMKLTNYIKYQRLQKKKRILGNGGKE